MTSFLSVSSGAWVLRAIILLALVMSALWVKSRIDLSYEAAALKNRVSALTYMFNHERQRRVATEKFARATQLKLEGAVAEIAGRAKDAVIKTQRLVPKSSACDYSSDIVSMLNRARGYDP